MSTPDPTPVPTTERWPLLDALRGFALLGILFGNLMWFTGYAVLPAADRAALGTAGADELAAQLVHFAVDGKFYALFALLFGAGFAVQSRRTQRSASGFRRFFARRSGVLLAFGVLHATLVWFGDILSVYALTGLCLLSFRGRSDRCLLSWSVALLLAPAAWGALWLWLPSGREGYGPVDALPAFGGGGYSEVLRANWAFLKERWFLLLYEGRCFRLLGLFLLGYWAARRGVFGRPAAHRRLLRAALWSGLAVGVPANWALGALFPDVPLRPQSAAGVLRGALQALGVPALSLAYAAAFALASASPRLRRLVRLFAPAGRMSLTHYVGQSIVGAALFYGIGFGLWGRVGAAWSGVLALAIFAAQALASSLWLRRFRFGPLEWLWRSLSYGRPLPMRLPRAGDPAGQRPGAPPARLPHLE